MSKPMTHNVFLLYIKLCDDVKKVLSPYFNFGDQSTQAYFNRFEISNHSNFNILFLFCISLSLSCDFLLNIEF